jgi:hypothetical protein
MAKPDMPPTRKSMRLRLGELNIEYKSLSSEANAGNTAALARRSEISRDLRALSETLHLREPDVAVTVPRSASGHPFRIGGEVFYPGVRTVKRSVAQYLLWLIDVNRQNELNRLRSNGTEVDLGTIGDKARMGLEDREL